MEEACREHGVKYAVHPSFRAGLAAHYRWLRRLGAGPGGGRASADEPPREESRSFGGTARPG